MKRVEKFEELALGDIGFKLGDDFFGRAIEDLSTPENSVQIAPSHTFIVGPRRTIFEAWLKAREQPLDKYKHYWECGRVRAYRPDVCFSARLDAYTWIVKRYVGTWYGILQIVGHLLVLLHLTKKNIYTRGVVCHELATYFLRRLSQEQMIYEGRSDLWWVFQYDPEVSTPAELEQLCKEK